MTVTVRPVPKRTYQNGIRPFRPVVPTNNIRPYTLKTWRPPVPEPLAPAPLLGPKELLGLGLLVLAQLWGRVNSRGSLGPVIGGESQSFSGGTTRYKVTTSGTVVTTGISLCSNSLAQPDTSAGGPVTSNWVGPFASVRVEPGPGTTTVQYNCSGTTSTTQSLARVIGVAANGSETVISSFLFTAGTVNNSGAWRGTRTYKFSVDNLIGENGWSWERSTRPEGVADFDPQPLPYLPYLPKTLPGVAPASPPAIPKVAPDVVPTTPGPTAPPATAPQVPLRTVPLPLPGATPTKDGAIVPQAPATVAVTPPDAHFPVPGAPPVTGNGPRPTPEGIAQELGRLEQKLARLSDPGPEGPGDGSDRLQLISDLIGRLIEFATSMTSGGGYSLSSPCELDENGDRIVSTVEYSGATNSLGVLSNKIDALAGVLQVHKDLKQPNCKQAPAVGQPVTVNFVQVD